MIEYFQEIFNKKMNCYGKVDISMHNALCIIHNCELLTVNCELLTVNCALLIVSHLKPIAFAVNRRHCMAAISGLKFMAQL